ncbi:hypothetical protein BGZ91_007991 [Linnemannia elongata]|nr:hypothetical protein BGZ91_007991 [Linnemannia elongata]
MESAERHKHLIRHLTIHYSAYVSLSSRNKVASSITANWTLTTLNLDENSIGDNGAQALAEALKTNSTLTTLELQNNSIGYNGVQALAEALKTNSTLTTLYLDGNSIGDNGAEALRRVSTTTRCHISH